MPDSPVQSLSSGSETKATPASTLRVLVVEDTEDAARLVAAYLKKWGHDSWVCTSGNEALAVAPNYKPDVILIDIGLPDMTGWELARRLPRGPLLVAITGRGDEKDFDRSRDVGIRYHLVKPAFQGQLRDLLDRFAQGRA